MSTDLPEEELRRRAGDVAWLVFDVDGVLTTGALLYASSGDELLSFDIKDGLGVKLAMEDGLHTALLSGRASEAVRKRARELGFDALVLGRSDKAPAFAELLEAHDIDPRAVAAIGDDLQDLPMLLRCGLSFAPADAVPEVLERVDVVLESRGGRGAVREMVEAILRWRGAWDRLVERFVP